VLGLLAERGLSLGVIETVSAGYMANRLATAVHGREAFAGGVVAQSDAVVAHFLGDDPSPLASSAAAAHLARAARVALVADVGIASTAVESKEDETDEHPFGTVWVAVSMEGFETVEAVRLPGDLDRIRLFSVISVLNLLRLHLEGRR